MKVFSSFLCLGWVVLVWVAGMGPAWGDGEKTLGVQGLVVRADGRIRFGGDLFCLTHFGEDWASLTQAELAPGKGFPSEAGGVWKVEGTIGGAGGKPGIEFGETVTARGASGCEVVYEAKAPPDWTTKQLAVGITLPVARTRGQAVMLDGRSIALPVEQGGEPVFLGATPAHRLSFPSADGLGLVTVSGTFHAFGQDGRKWGEPTYQLRLLMPPEGGELKIELSYAPYAVRVFGLAGLKVAKSAAVSGASAEAGGAGAQQAETATKEKAAAGWKKAMAMAGFTGSPVRLGAVEFPAVAASKARAGAVLILEPGEMATVAADGKPAASLFLLQGAQGGAPGVDVGTITAVAADGAETKFPVVCGKDIGPWEEPAGGENGALAWSGSLGDQTVGMYVSRFGLGGAALKEIRLENTGSAAWAVAGVAAAADVIPLGIPKWVSKAGRDWAAYEMPLRIEPGSVFDEARLNEAPAGRDGPLIVTPEGHFAFADKPDKRVRFYGVNTCFEMNYLSHEHADQLAELLARSGYNAVRMHHYDGLLVRKGGPTNVFDAERLDKLDYYFAALKKRGVYVTIDLFTIRQLSEKELPGFGPNPSSLLKMLVAVSDQAFDVWAGFVKTLLAHKNPYTGLTWAEDPALVAICPLNEDTIFAVSNGARARAILAPYFAEWQKANARAGEAEDVAFNRFLTETANKSNAKIFAFLKSLGTKALLTGSNFMSNQAATLLREHYDYVDNHEYFNHPTFPVREWSLPSGTRTDADPLKEEAALPRTLMPARVFGKPYTVTEFNFTWPNAYRAASGALMPGYAGLQDWDGLLSFDFGANGNFPDPGTNRYFDIGSDPIGMLADRIAATVFRRGEVEAARTAACYAVEEREAFAGRGWGIANFPKAFSELGFVLRIGSLPGAPEAVLDSAVAKAQNVRLVVTGSASPLVEGKAILPADDHLATMVMGMEVAPQGSLDPAQMHYRSETGQMELAGQEGTFKLVTPSAECFVLDSGRSLSGGSVSVENGERPGTVFVLSADGRPVSESGRLLVAHLTEVMNTGTVFSDASRTLLEDFGRLPYLVRRGAAEIRIRTAAPGGWRAWVVDTSGKRLRAVPLEEIGGELRLRAETVTAAETALAYELAREEEGKAGKHPGQP